MPKTKTKPTKDQTNAIEFPEAFEQRVCVLLDDAETIETSAGGIILPETAQEAGDNIGRVVNAGHEDLKHLVGKRITFHNIGVTDLSPTWMDVVIVPRGSIVAVLP